MKEYKQGRFVAEYEAHYCWYIQSYGEFVGRYYINVKSLDLRNGEDGYVSLDTQDLLDLYNLIKQIT